MNTRMVKIGPGSVAARLMAKRAAECKHPPAKLYSWFAFDGVLCVACSCGKVLKGGV